MTEDTKRALEIIEPMAKELNIDLSADDRLLYCNGQAIGIALNSAYATVKEFLGYAMIWIGQREDRWEVPEKYANEIKRYWLSKDQMKNIEKRKMQYRMALILKRACTGRNDHDTE